jgi:hypothetical protein
MQQNYVGRCIGHNDKNEESINNHFVLLTTQTKCITITEFKTLFNCYL